QVLHKLLDKADVLVSNLAPGATGRLGLGPEDLAGKYPRLIGVEISGYGRGGPLSLKRAYDLLVQSEAGACAITRLPRHPAAPAVRRSQHRRVRRDRGLVGPRRASGHR